jgi:hypothetical protein
MFGFCFSKPCLDQGEDDVLEGAIQILDDIPPPVFHVYDVETFATESMNLVLHEVSVDLPIIIEEKQEED